MAAVIEVWNRANSAKVNDITTTTDNAVRLAAMEELNSVGGFNMTVQADHANAASLTGGACVRVYDGATLVNTSTIEEVTTVQVDDNDSAKTVSVQGSGLLNRWSESVVEPWIDGRPISVDRVWNWASPPLVTTSWTAVVQVPNTPEVFPEAWPVAPTFGGWINSRALAASIHPTGDTLFRRPFTLATAETVVFYVAADDSFELWIDGVLLEREPNKQPDRSGYESTWRYVVQLSAGTHVPAVRLMNWGGPARLIFAAFEVATDVLGDVIFTSAEDFGWVAKDYPANFPGFTAVQILQMLLDEAQARGELTGWTIDSTGSFDEIEEFTARLGDTYLSVINALSATHIDVAVDNAGLVLKVWPKATGRGTTTAVDLVEGVNLLALTETVDNEFYNAVQAVWTEAARWRTDATSIAANGRRSTSFQLGGASNLRSVDQILDAFLDAYATPITSVVAEVESTSGAVAGINYLVGDVVDVDAVPLRVVGITWTIEQDGSLVAAPEFDTLLAVRQQEKRRSIDRQVAQFEQPATASILDPGTQIPSGKVGTETANWSWTGDIEESLRDGDPDALWQPYRLDRVRRIYRFEVEINDEDLPDATGNSVFTLNKNGALINGLYNLTLSTTVEQTGVQVYGYETVRSTDRVSPACIATGNHVDGTVTVRFADAV